jgi:hypothetical protein
MNFMSLLGGGGGMGGGGSGQSASSSARSAASAGGGSSSIGVSSQDVVWIAAAFAGVLLIFGLLWIAVKK